MGRFHGLRYTAGTRNSWKDLAECSQFTPRGSKYKCKSLEKPKKEAVEIVVETLQGFGLLCSILGRGVPGLLPCCHE